MGTNGKHPKFSNWRDPLFRGQIRLPMCLSCEHTIYPPRENCPLCLSDNLQWLINSNLATVLATTTLHHSFEPEFQRRLPLSLALLELETGPIVIANGLPALAPGDIVVAEVVKETAGGFDVPVFRVFSLNRQSLHK